MKRCYTISDVINKEFIRFPMSLLANPRYKAISLEAKMIYALLLNRLSLSQKNGWVNEEKEVYLIYTREEAAEMLGISYKKAIGAFKELIAVSLLYEVRQGRGFPNLLYVLKAELSNEDAEQFEEIIQNCQNDSSRNADSAVQDLTEMPFKTCQNDSSKPAENTVQELPKQQATKNNMSYTEKSEIEKSLSVHQEETDKQTDENYIHDILSRCELEIFPEGAQQMFQFVIERLYYSGNLKVGNAVFPQSKLRNYLQMLDTEVLTGVYDKLMREKPKVKNMAAYLMVMVVNELLEKHYICLKKGNAVFEQ